MDLIPESRQALDEFGPFGGDDDLQEYLVRAADLVRTIVPTCVGISLASVRDGVTFTLEATSADVAALDAVQYVDGGPCDDGAHEDETVRFQVGDPTDEERWLLFARSTAAADIASTLTLPIEEEEQVVGTVNFYAARAHAFDGHEEPLAAVFGAWAPGAVKNADLGFETRRAAERAPQVMREQVEIGQAVGILVAVRGHSPDEARRLIEDAALRAGVEPVQLAREVVKASGLTDP